MSDFSRSESLMRNFLSCYRPKYYLLNAHLRWQDLHKDPFQDTEAAVYRLRILMPKIHHLPADPQQIISCSPVKAPNSINIFAYTWYKLTSYACLSINSSLFVYFLIKVFLFCVTSPIYLKLLYVVTLIIRQIGPPTPENCGCRNWKSGNWPWVIFMVSECTWNVTSDPSWIWSVCYILRLRQPTDQPTNSFHGAESFLRSWQSLSHEIPRLSCHPKVHYRAHNTPQLLPILSQMHPVHTFPPDFHKVNSNIIYLSTPTSSVCYVR